MSLRKLSESIGELQKRFFSERPPTDPDRERDRADKDRMRQVFARAESFATMGPPVDASLEPVSAPENVQLLANGGVRDSEASNDITDSGMSRGIEAGRNALIQEAGYSARGANALAQQVINGEMSEQQFKRVVEQELGASETSGKVNPHRGSTAAKPDSRRPDPKGERRQSGVADGVKTAVNFLRGDRR